MSTSIHPAMSGVFPTKEAALDALEVARADYIAAARAKAREMARHGRLITVDDIRAECPPPEGVDKRVMGAILRAPEWKATGYVNSTRATCHKRPIQQFEYVGAE